MSLIRSDLRLALTAGLANAFATLSPLPFGIYMPLAVLAVCTGTFGGSIELGRQRILGSLLGMGLLVVAMKGLSGVPFPLAIAIVLGTLRLIGGLLGLEVGYKVGGFIVVMGWLVHDQQLASWVPLRLFWTTSGIVMGVLSMRLLWPSRALPQSWRLVGALLQSIAQTLDQVAGELEAPNEGPTTQAITSGSVPTVKGVTAPSEDGTKGTALLQPLRQQLGSLRGGMKAVQSELGDSGRHSPQMRLMLALMDACSTLISVLEGLLRHSPAPGATGTLITLQQGEADLVRAVADRLRCWAPLIAQPGGGPLRSPPQPPWRSPTSWQQLQPLLTDCTLSEAELPRLRRHASRLVLCGQADRAMTRTETLWLTLTSRPRGQQLPARLRGALP
jgi:hypothetical protein